MATINREPHVLVIPYPAQGHVMPLMKFSYCLADRGFRITFVNPESIHDRLVGAALSEKGETRDRICLVPISDGLMPEELKDPFTLINSLNNHVPGEIEKLIKINESSENGKFSCIIADEMLGWGINIATKMGIPHASFFPGAAGLKALTLHIPKLIEMGAIDGNGTPRTKDTIVWSPTMPDIKPDHLPWYCMGGLIPSEAIFHSFIRNNDSSKSTKWVFCNTSEELEHAAVALVPNLIPIGPLLGSNQLGNFWPEDMSCLSWLDQQAARSVIYIAFGSLAILDQRQFSELALGLELLGRPFLWVVRSDLFDRPAPMYPDGFEDRVDHLGKTVGWAPQRKVLAHPSIACFVSHCGWNSVIEGVCSGVPFICWPYFADQFLNETHITNTWRIGVGLEPNEDGIISGDEFEKKVNNLLQDKEIEKNAVQLKETAMKSVGEGRSSSKNLELFMEELQG